MHECVRTLIAPISKLVKMATPWVDDHVLRERIPDRRRCAMLSPSIPPDVMIECDLIGALADFFTGC